VVGSHEESVWAGGKELAVDVAQGVVWTAARWWGGGLDRIRYNTRQVERRNRQAGACTGRVGLKAHDGRSAVMYLGCRPAPLSCCCAPLSSRCSVCPLHLSSRCFPLALYFIDWQGVVDRLSSMILKVAKFRVKHGNHFWNMSSPACFQPLTGRTYRSYWA